MGQASHNWTERDKRDRTLERLLARCALQDAGAFKALYELASPVVFAVLLRILKQRDSAEDALQETFVSVWHRAGDYRAKKGRPLTWLTSIARYRAIDIVRRRRREQSIEALPEELTADGDAGIRAVDATALGKCLDELAERQKASIRLAYLNGYTHEEVARALQAPLGTVKSWVRRGLLALKDCLSPHFSPR